MYLQILWGTMQRIKQKLKQIRQSESHINSYHRENFGNEESSNWRSLLPWTNNPGENDKRIFRTLREAQQTWVSEKNGGGRGWRSCISTYTTATTLIVAHSDSATHTKILWRTLETIWLALWLGYFNIFNVLNHSLNICSPNPVILLRTLHL